MDKYILFLFKLFFILLLLNTRVHAQSSVIDTLGFIYNISLKNKGSYHKLTIKLLNKSEYEIIKASPFYFNRRCLLCRKKIFDTCNLGEYDFIETGAGKIISTKYIIDDFKPKTIIVNPKQRKVVRFNYRVSNDSACYFIDRLFIPELNEGMKISIDLQNLKKQKVLYYISNLRHNIMGDSN